MIATAQFEIQIVDTHESLETLINVDVVVGTSQFNRTLVSPNKDSGEWRSLPSRNAPTGPIAGTPLVLISDWWTESDINDSGFSEAAGDALFASLIDLNKAQNEKLFNSSFHFIAHSRGTVVTSELLQRLGEYETRVLHKNLDIHLTTLDVHDELNGPQTNLRPFNINWTDFNEPSVSVWSNVDFADSGYPFDPSTTE
jgi:hypothetical protein